METLVEYRGRKKTENGASRCIAPDRNHSSDLFAVYRGKTTPELVCGYHALANTVWRNESE